VILGVSHLAIRSRALDADRQALESQGWVTAFVDHDVRVHAFERPFLSPSHGDTQSLVLLRQPRVPAVELVAPVLTPPERAHHTRLDLDAAAQGRLHGTLEVPDAAACQALFLECFGFRRTGGDEARVEVELRRPLAQWSMGLTLRQGVAAQPMPTQDSEGWFVLALFTSDVAADAERARKYDVAAVTQPFVTRVSGQRWTIALVILRSGFAIELLQPSADATAGGE
jgi:hypothetical protein